MYLGPGIEVSLDLQEKSLACLICGKFGLLADIEPRDSKLLFFEGEPVGCSFFWGLSESGGLVVGVLMVSGVM